MDLHLKDKVIIVTGGAKGIGAAIVRQLADEGALPVIVDLDAKAGAGLTQSMNAAGLKCHFVEADLCDTRACEGVIRTVISQHSTLDGLVNNAGVNDGVGLAKGSPEAFRKSLDKNLGHFYDIAHFALPHLKKSEGPILNIASKTAITGQGGTSGYAAAKGGVLALTREWAVELLQDHIRVNAIVPAEVMTPLYESWLNSFDDPQAKRKQIEGKIPLDTRMTTSQEIADTAVFLLSDRASHITGQHFYVDGGYTHLDRLIESK